MYIFFFNDTATTEIYTLSLHDALPISSGADRLARMLRDRGILSARVPDLPPGVRSPQRTVRRRGGQGWPQRHSKPLVRLSRGPCPLYGRAALQLMSLP